MICVQVYIASFVVDAIAHIMFIGDLFVVQSYGCNPWEHEAGRVLPDPRLWSEQ